MDDASYLSLGDGRYRPTVHVQGAWNDDEQHLAPVSGLLTQVIAEHEPRDDVRIARLSFEALGKIPLDDVEISVATRRPGKTIELVEAELRSRGQAVVLARAWRLLAFDTVEVAGGTAPPMPAPGIWPASQLAAWSGGFIRTLEVHAEPTAWSGDVRAWLRTGVPLLADRPVHPLAAYVGVVDTANGLAARVDPETWLFPNVDLTVHLLRTPQPGWVGLAARATYGGEGLGVTGTILYDEQGMVGRAEQCLTVRPRG